MARESKRKRDERRLGRSERLADLFGVEKFAAPIGFDDSIIDEACRPTISESIAKCVIDATNVFEYTLGLQNGSRQLGFKEMIVNAIPPFSDCFVEFRLPPNVSPQVRNIGWSIQAFSRGEEPEIVYESLLKFPCPETYAACRWIVVGTMIMRMAVDEAPGSPCGIICPAAQSVILLDETGSSLQPPFLSIEERYAEIDMMDWMQMWAHSSTFDFMLAFCFMNCKNVTITPVDPDPAVNRERRKSGLKPFLRYHTINIEPMKHVLRTEGGIETNGLKKALHICRGHFKTYKTAYMGRELNKPITFWVPSHVKGTAKQGVVVSDYNVKAPR